MNPVAVQRGATLLLLMLALVAFTADDAVAQWRSDVRPELVMDQDGVYASPPVESYSNFRLRGLADLAFGGARGRGSVRMKLSNAGINEYYAMPVSGIQWLQLGTAAGTAQRLFQGSIAMVSPRTEWEKARVRLRDEAGIESLSNVTGGGYNNVRNITHFSLYQPERWLPADDQLGLVHSGATSRNDGSCADFTRDQVPTGLALMAVSDCPETWGSDQFAGAQRSIPLANWMQFFNDVGPENFHWDWWRVPEEYKTDQLMGDFQTYGKIVDWAAERRARFGSVLPDGAGAPIEQGWPMGISIYFDAFTFELPTMANTVFWQATVVNESERVWGIGLDYDSLYLGMMHGVVMGNQASSEYYRPDLGGVIVAGNGITPGCNNARVPSGVTGCQTTGGSQGAFALLVLNSPLGDLRNKLFTREGSPFYAPNHPNAGDTITFNIGRMCGFGVACWNSTLDFNNRSGFGYIAGVVEDLFAGRTATDFDQISGSTWFRVFRNYDYPERTPEWNKWVVQDWDWNKDGVPDTISVPSCLGPEFGGPATGYPCSEIFSDTLPGRLNNAGNNIGGFIGFGPFKLAAGDTTRWTMALVSGPTPTNLMSAVHGTLAFYEAGFLRPSAPPAPRIVSVNTTPGDRGRNPGARVQIFLDDSPEEFVDEFLLFQAEQLEGTQLAIDNPWLVDSIRTVAHNNLQAIRVYKSCNAGRNFTATSNCFGNPAVDENGNSIGLGWQPYAVFEADEDGRVPNVFQDAAVTAGVRYMYVFVAESRGFTADVLDRDPETDAIIPARIEIAPKLTNPLSTSASDPNVISVYVPASRQAGARPATVAFHVEDPRAPVEFCAASARPCPVDVQLTSEDVPGGTFRIVFGDSVVVRAIDEPVRGAGGAVVDRQLRTEVHVYRTVMTSPDGTTVVRTAYEEQTYTMPGAAGVTTSGGTTSVEAQPHGAQPGDTTYVTTTVFGDVLTLVTLNANNQPMLVSSTLTGSTATPGTFLGRPDFPGFMVRADATRGGTHVATTWLEQGTDEDRTLRGGGSPMVSWIAASASATGRGYGEYRFDFTAPEFGPTRLFRVNVVNPSETRSAFEQSVSQRQGHNTAAGEDIAAAIRATGTATGDADITANDLVTVSVPFTVTNTTTGREVIVAMRRSAKRDSIPLGTGVNQVNVGVPSDKWVPGEPLVFLERLTKFRTALTADGAEYVVLDASGRPVVHDTLVVTWNAAVLGCEAPVTCNPLVHGTPGAAATGYLPITPGLEYLRVRYQNALTTASAYEFEVVPPVEGDKVMAVTGDDLFNIKVVPNPYVVFSQFEQLNAERKLMFMGLPPRGTISIFTVAGQFVQRLTYTEADLAGNGDLFWDMRTYENNEVASGLYLFVVEGVLPASGQTVRKTGKFVVIRGS